MNHLKKSSSTLHEVQIMSISNQRKGTYRAGNRFACPISICGVKVGRKDSILRHVKKMKDPRHKSWLSKHKQQNKPFVCSACSRRFTRKDNLSRHMKTTKDDKHRKYLETSQQRICEHCNALFLNSESCNKHTAKCVPGTFTILSLPSNKGDSINSSQGGETKNDAIHTFNGSIDQQKPPQVTHTMTVESRCKASLGEASQDDQEEDLETFVVSPWEAQMTEWPGHNALDDSVWESTDWYSTTADTLLDYTKGDWYHTMSMNPATDWHL